MSDATKICPFCAETIKSAAVVCRFCNRDLAGSLQRQAPVLQSTLRNCPDCGGRGQVNVACYICAGNGREYCQRCGGTGLDDSSILGNVARCNVCHGSREVRCDHCNGSGNELETCSTCDGCGQMTFQQFEDLKRKRKEEEQRLAKEAERRALLQAEEQTRSERLREQQEAQQKAEAERKKQQAMQVRQEEEVRLRKLTHRCLICGKDLGFLNAILGPQRQEHKECVGKPPSW